MSEGKWQEMEVGWNIIQNSSQHKIPLENSEIFHRSVKEYAAINIEFINEINLLAYILTDSIFVRTTINSAG